MNSEQELKIMKARAAKLAEPIIEHASSQDIEFVRFSLEDGGEYGIAYEFVEGIIKPDKLALVPCAPEAVTGVVSWRGSLLAVADISLLFGGGAQIAKQRPWVVVVQQEGKRLGLLAAVMRSSKIFSASDLKPNLAAEQGQKSEYIQGTIGENIAILKVEALFSSKKLMF